MFSWYYIEGILIQSCYTLLIVLGLSILTGYTGMFSFGHAGFVCIGAYVSILCTMAFGLPYWLSLIIAGLAAMLLGAGLGKITLNLKGDYFCIATLGVCQVPEGRLIFANLTVYENLKVGAYLRSDKDGIERDLKRVYEIFPRLEERKNQIAGTLSGGEQQMLAMGRGIMSAPDLIMLDEPSLGLAPLLVNTIFDTIREIKAMGKTILLVEQNALKALSVADNAYVLEQGRITKSGPGKELLKDPAIAEAYLGKAAR